MSSSSDSEVTPLPPPSSLSTHDWERGDGFDKGGCATTSGLGSGIGTELDALKVAGTVVVGEYKAESPG